jgi:hypothetical protein
LQSLAALRSASGHAAVAAEKREELAPSGSLDHLVGADEQCRGNIDFDGPNKTILPHRGSLCR